MIIISTLVIFHLIALIPITASLMLSLIHLKNNPVKVYLYLSLTWGCFVLWGITRTLFLMTFNEVFLVLNLYVLILKGYFIILFIDTMLHDALDPKKILVFTIIAVAVITFSLDSDSIIITESQGDFIVLIIPAYTLIIFLMNLFNGGLIIYGFVRVFLQSPKSVKNYAGLNVIGALLFGMTGNILITLGINFLIPGSFPMVMGVGAFLSGYAFYREPKIAYVLPFKSMHLAVIETNGGLLIFEYDWSQKGVQETLFAGMLQAVNLFVKDTLDRGEFKEIRMDEGVLIIDRYRQNSLAFVLLASNASKSLREALALFKKTFITRYSQFFEELNNTGHFESATELITECFPFIPENDELVNYS